MSYSFIIAHAEFSKVQQSFANNIKNIEFEMISEECTQEEVMIGDLTINNSSHQHYSMCITKFLFVSSRVAENICRRVVNH